MQDCLTTGIARFAPPRKLRLSADQIAPRLANLTVLDDKRGDVEVTRAVEFKAGERIGVDGEISRADLAVLEPVKRKSPAKKSEGAGADQPPPSGADQPPPSGADEPPPAA
jgi:hypothetical protein